MAVEMGQDAAHPQGAGEHSRLGDVLHATARGAVGAMAMTGMRVLMTDLGLVEQTRHQAVSRPAAAGAAQAAPGLVEAAHWTFGVAGGAVFCALPDTVRRRPWAGPVYGLVAWLGFELGIAPVLGLSQATRVGPVDRSLDGRPVARNAQSACD